MGVTTRREHTALNNWNNSLTDMNIRQLAIAASVIPVLTGVIVLVFGWLLNIDWVVRLFPDFAGMAPSTSFCLIILGALLIAIHTHSLPRETQVRYVVSGIVAGVAVISILMHLGGRPSGVDSLLFPDISSLQGARMSLSTAAGIFLASCCLGPFWQSSTVRNKGYVLCSTLGLLLAMIAVVGYLFDARALYEVSLFTAMALHTAVALFFLFCALLLSRPQICWVGVLLSEGNGSAGARRLFPIALLLPLTLCLLTLVITEQGLMNANFRLSVLSILIMVILCSVVLFNATIQNRVEQQLRTTLAELNTTIEERNVLFKEVYHRVKNNLQQISAMINMEVFQLEEGHAKRALVATADRVSALGTVHSLLMSSSKLSALDNRALFTELLNNIGESYGAKHRGIALHLEVDEEYLNMDAAILLGLIVNEFVVNCFKHAFKQDAGGSITVRYLLEDDDFRRLEIHDDGKDSTPEEASVTLENSGMGTRIAHNLITQLRGEMTVCNEEGTRISIRIPAASIK